MDDPKQDDLSKHTHSNTLSSESILNKILVYWLLRQYAKVQGSRLINSSSAKWIDLNLAHATRISQYMR